MADDEGISSEIETPDIEEIQVTGSARIVAKYDGASPAMSCAVFPNSEQFAVGWSSGIIEVRNTKTLEEVHKLGTSSDLPATSLSGCTSDDGKELLLSSFASGETVMWDVVKGEELWKIAEERQSLVNGFSPDYSQFAVAGSDSKISVYDVADQRLAQVLQGSVDPDVMDGHTMRVFALRFHPTRQHEIVSGGWDDTIQFWDVRQSYSNRRIRGPHMCGEGIEFLDDNRFITASWTRRNPLQIWDYRTAKLVENVRPDDLPCFLYCCQYIEPKSVILTGGSHENMLRVIDTKIFKTLVSFRNLRGAIYFAKELPRESSLSHSTNICFCSHTSVYLAEIEV